MSRVVCWFSCGTPSAVAAHLAVRNYEENDLVIAPITIPNEHVDNERFSDDISRQVGHDIIDLKSSKYTDTWDVYERTRYLVGPMGARCTTELKKLVRREFQQVDDIQVFGFTSDEKDRADDFRLNNPEIELRTPLIDAGLTRRDCHRIVESWNIRLPAMYLMGYRNNNCIGCVKGGMGYWNKIRRDFPDVYARMALVERNIGVAICSTERREGTKRIKVPVFLDELSPRQGRYSNEKDMECSLICVGAPS